jgi:hypothetical protein
LVRIEAAEFPQTPPDRFPFDFARHGIFLLQVYMLVCIKYVIQHGRTRLPVLLINPAPDPQQ